MNIPQVNELISKGIKVIDPQTTYIDQSVKITGKGTVIHPNTFLKGNTEIKEKCEIGPNSFLNNAKIDENVKITFSHIEDSHIKENCTIGPYSRIRNNSEIGRNVSIGNFAEIKSSLIGDYSNIRHYSYIGDALIGNNVNIGAGTITCNYDGTEKHQTKIEDDVFLGAGTMLIAPVMVGEGAKTGAGSVVTKDVDDFVTVVGNPAKIMDNA
ncbi:MAG: DapH/DapD/GlmU-related protein [Dehalococcoidia bacterium]|tara:strand:- start:247 stop:879 length:633 start_codon:yes stop_codon:yes gene_type:complete